jgi:Uma2 family endonuclease
MGTVQKILPHYTTEDWRHWEGKWELIDGHPIAMSPTPVPEHQRVAAELRTEFILSLRKSGCKKCKAYDPIDYIISEDTILVPDILIACGEIKKKYLDFPPRLVVEILSPSTALRDRNIKYQLYEQQGVKYYLLVDIDVQKIEVYELADGKYSLWENNIDQPFELENDCRISPDFSAIFDRE